jgi:hypothetical protein
MEVLARAAQRLTELVGDTVIPLEDEISKVAAKQFPKFQLRYGPLATRLENLDCPAWRRSASLNQDLADVLLTDGSDAPQRLGGEESPLYERSAWPPGSMSALKHGLESTIRGLQRITARRSTALPGTGIPGACGPTSPRRSRWSASGWTKDDFFKHAVDLSSALTRIRRARATR